MVQRTTPDPTPPVPPSGSPVAADAALAHYTTLFELAPVADATLTCDGTLTLVNQAGARWLGAAPAELQGQPLSRFIQRADRAGFERWLGPVFSQHTAQRCQLNLLGDSLGTPGAGCRSTPSRPRVANTVGPCSRSRPARGGPRPRWSPARPALSVLCAAPATACRTAIFGPTTATSRHAGRPCWATPMTRWPISPLRFLIGCTPKICRVCRLR